MPLDTLRNVAAWLVGFSCGEAGVGSRKYCGRSPRPVGGAKRADEEQEQDGIPGAEEDGEEEN